MPLRVGHRVLAAAVVSLLAAGCHPTDRAPQTDRGGSSSNVIMRLFGGSRVTVPSGSRLEVRLNQTLSSKTAREGDRWHGVIVHPVVIDGREAIPSGADVEGVVVAAEAAQRGNRATLELGVTAVRIGDHKTSLRASSDPVIAGSPRARNLGAIAGGAAAGALIGEATSDRPGTGALIGGAIATGAVAASKGYQVVLPDGRIMRFVVNENVAVRVG